MHPALLSIALLPLLFRLLPFFLPARYLEPYTYWSSEDFNKVDGVVKGQWRNMGYWEGTEVYPEAAEALARKLLAMAGPVIGGNVLDIAHGAGESLALHLSQTLPPAHLHALTSLPSETLQAQNLVASRFPSHNDSTHIHWYTMSGSYKPGKDVGHPLNPMAGYLGEGGSGKYFDEDDDENDVDNDADERQTDKGEHGDNRETTMDSQHSSEGELHSGTTGKKGYDLVYILDAIYHFPPSVPYFLASVLPSLTEGGTLVYTDILPPPDLSAALAHLVIPPLFSVPARNLVNRPNDLDEYKQLLEKIGYTDVLVEDWSEGVWPGFGRFLRSRTGWGWKVAGRGIGWMERKGWKFVGVRARRPVSVVDA